MATFNVTWEMEFDAESFEEAAKRALEELRDQYSEATGFEVVKVATGETALIDVIADGLMDENLDLAPEVGC